MSIRTSPRRRQATLNKSAQRQFRNHVPRLPHPSWLYETPQFDSGTGQHIASATDFWSRLGA